MSSRISRLGKNTILVFIGNMGSKLIGLIMLPFYTRWLSVEDYGLTDIITVYVSFLIGFVTCCIGESLFVFPKGAELKKQKRFFTTGMAFLFAMLIITLLIFVLINIGADAFGIKNSFTDNIWLIYLLMFSSAAQQVTQQFTRSIDKVSIYSISGIINTVCTAVYAFIFIPPYGVAGFVWSMIFAHLTAGLFSFIFSKSYKYISVSCFDKKSLREMLKYSIPLIPNGIMWWLVSALNRPIMEHHLGLHDMGIYAVANKFPGILTMVFSVFAISWQISVLEEFGKEGYSSFYNKVFKTITGLLLVTLIIITLCSKLIINVFSTPDFYEAWRYIPLLTVGALFSCFSSIAGTNFSATKESKYYFYSSVWGAVSAIVLNFILIPMWGLWGTCISFILSFVVMALSRIAYAWKYVSMESIFSYVFVLLLSCIMVCIYIMDIGYFWNALLSIVLFIYICFWEKDIIISLLNFIRKRR